MPKMTNEERARAGALALHRGRTYVQRQQAGRRAYLAGAARSVALNWADLTSEQQDAIRIAAQK
jgi:hypothetical protein